MEIFIIIELEIANYIMGHSAVHMIEDKFLNDTFFKQKTILHLNNLHNAIIKKKEKNRIRNTRVPSYQKFFCTLRDSVFMSCYEILSTDCF